MATLIPSLNQSLAHMSSGEARVARRLEEKLEDDYLLWYDVPIGGTGRQPDFIIFNPRRGVLVLEVKDWKRDSLQKVDKKHWHLITSDGLVQKQNPLEQARDYALLLADLLKRDQALLDSSGNLIIPWAFGVVLTNITRRQLVEANLDQVLPAEKVICKDEMLEDVEPGAFQERLWGMFPWYPKRPISLPQIDRIRGAIFPELRIGAQRELFGKEEVKADLPDLIRIMDLQQEQLARSLGGGHRVIHGVAGSGKTMILGYRCIQLAKHLRKPVLVLCFNRALSLWLDEQLRARGVTESVHVRSFHVWCREQLVHYQVGLPPRGLDSQEYAEQLVQRVIAGADRGLIPLGQYGAVLIDEGHDFEPEWLKLVAQMVSPDTNSLLLLYDDAQSIYQKKRFSFRSVGIQAQGRTTILHLNYRNTAEILSFAHDFARDVLEPKESDDDGIPLIAPKTAGRHGPSPELLLLPSLGSEVAFIAEKLGRLHEKGRIPWRDMAVLYRSKRVGELVASGLSRVGIPAAKIEKGARGHGFLDSDSVKLTTFHSSKGLEFPVVAIPGVRKPDAGDSRAKEEAKLLYVAMTRALQELIVTGPSSPRS